MKEHFLDFERPLAEIIEKIEALQAASNEDPELLGLTVLDLHLMQPAEPQFFQ